MTIKNIKSALFKNRTKILLLLIIATGIFLRFVNYDNRFGIAADQARDVLIVRQALALHTLPLIGPFSAAGSFVFGPFWYWIFMLPIGLFSNSLLAPWIFQSILYVLVIPIMFLAGRRILSEKFGILLAFFTAISTKEITLSTNLIISALVGFFAFVIFYLLIKFLKDRKAVFMYAVSFLISFLINTHFEAIPLIILLPVMLIFSKNKLKDFIFSLLFFAIPFIPLFIFNLNSNFYETRNIFNVHQTGIGRTTTQVMQAWFNLAFNFIPRVWRDVIGANNIITNSFITVGLILTFFRIWRRKMPKEIMAVFLSFILMLGFLLLYKGRVFENFMSFLFPFILFLSAWNCYILFKVNKYLAIFIFLVITGFTLFSDFTVIKNAVNNTNLTTNYFKNQLNKKYPNQKFSLYNYNNINNDVAYSLSLYLDLEGRINEKGTIIGLANVGAPINHQIIIVNKKVGLTIYSLTGTNDKENGKQNFAPVNPNNIYDSTENWFKH